MDVSTSQGAVAAPGLVYPTKGCAAPGGVYTTGPELSLDLSTVRYTSVVCAGPGQHKGDRQQHSPEHLL